LGVDEPLNETAYGTGLVVRGKHFLIIESPPSSALYHRVHSQRIYMQPLATYSLPQLSYVDYSSIYRQTWSALTSDLPFNVHLLTFDQLNTKEYLIRVEHYFELNEDDTYSGAVTFDLQKIFDTQGTVTSITEMTLGGNLPLNDMNRLVWTTINQQSSKNNARSKIYILICLKSFFDFFRRDISKRFECCSQTNGNSNIPCDGRINGLLKVKRHFMILILLYFCRF
jgi:lysosomal alpha-mannosidase